eukprot:TRINITY_DN46344_c0_g1_i1.p1 TRINITY_DN46344_c0_g1~~TRINITY_DN46344_c0_g1_i1.p1  ORF type:complete len:128 (-),score=25.45 TRINITY_DN46344_c0_g1_i1:102-485(-)
MEHVEWADHSNHGWSLDAGFPLGSLISNSSYRYYIPGARDIPQNLRVTLHQAEPNPKAVLSSRGIGEPPVFLAASVFFAIRAAVAAANPSRGYLALDAPATIEQIRMAVGDNISKNAAEDTASPGES